MKRIKSRVTLWLKRANVFLTSPSGFMLLLLLLMAIIAGYFAFQNARGQQQLKRSVENQERILEALCGEKDPDTCQPIERLITNSNQNTQTLEDQGKDIQDLRRLSICILDAFGIALPEGVENGIDCERVILQFSQSPSGPGGGNSPRQSSGSGATPPDDSGNGDSDGGGEEPATGLCAVPVVNGVLGLISACD